MTRYARVVSSIWSDPDFVALGPAPQRMFLLLLSQPKLTMVGALDYVPARWAAMSSGTTIDEVEQAVADLEEARFVLVDRDRAELVIRTYVRNDRVCRTWQLVKAMWDAWSAMASPLLRRAVLAELPAEAWTTERAQPPPLACHMRSDLTSDISTDATSDVRSEPLPPSTIHLPPPPSSSARPRTSAPAAEPPASDDEDDGDRCNQVVNAYVRLQRDRQAERIGNPEAWARKVRKNLLAERRDELRTLLVEHPGASPTDIARRLAGDHLPERCPKCHQPLGANHTEHWCRVAQRRNAELGVA